MLKKVLAGAAVTAFPVSVPSGAALAKHGADDPVPGCSHHCDDGPDQRRAVGAAVPAGAQEPLRSAPGQTPAAVTIASVRKPARRPTRMP